MAPTQRPTEPLPAQSAEPHLLSVRVWAAAVGVGRDRAYALVHEGRVRHVALGRSIKIPRTEVAAFAEREAKGVMDEMTVQGPDRTQDPQQRPRAAAPRKPKARSVDRDGPGPHI
jgi:excisionase family DNA binding protein